MDIRDSEVSEVDSIETLLALRANGELAGECLAEEMQRFGLPTSRWQWLDILARVLVIFAIPFALKTDLMAA
jgi:hypothetical protein